jgi:hypothetical protein
MISSIDQAAEHLLREITLPSGAVNTLAFFDAEGPLIRVLVDPMFWSVTPRVPALFEGYRVRVEKRGNVSPLH